MIEPPADPVEVLFDQAVALPAGERAAFLDAACQSDPDLRAEVESLLSCDGRARSAGDFLDGLLLRVQRERPAFGPPAAAGEVGTLGPYRIVKPLGKGGMGAVYVALDPRLGRRLALKVMLPQFAADAAARGRFLREARAAARITHDNVVTVHEADEKDGVAYIAMQLLEGCPLDEYLKENGPPPLAQVLRIAGEAAAGLAAAHRVGLVHRDVKPANLWIEAPHGRVKVLDFGLAKPLDAEVELTQTGAVVGTPAYMSPEQARGDKVDHRTDLFSLGAVLYRLCGGRLPFEGRTTMAVLTALATQPPPPLRSLNPAVPEPLAELIHQLLAKEPDDRPPSAEDVVRRVRAIADGAPEADAQSTAVAAATVEGSRPTPPMRRPARRRWAWAAVALIAVVAAVAGIGAALRDREPDGGPVAESDRPAAEWVLSLGGVVRVNGAMRDINATSDLPAGRSTLTAVDLRDRHAVTGAGLAHLVGCGELQSLHLGGTGVDDTGLEHVGKLTGVTYLGLQGTKVTDDGLAPLRWLPRLAHLDLYATAVTEAGLVHLKDCPALTALGLGSTRVNGEGLAHLKALRGLTDVSLFGTPVGDTGLAHLKNCPALTKLYLGSTGATDAGVAHLLALPRLSHLLLDGCDVTDDGLALLGKLRSLQHLDVRKTRVTAKGLADFRAALATCEVVHDGGTGQALDVDRRAAEWVLGLGGFVRLRDVGEIKALAQLPPGQFSLSQVDFSVARPERDADFANLAGLELTHLNLHAVPIADAGLAHLTRLKRLNYLNLERTPVTNAGLPHLRDIAGLDFLYLSSTAVTDAGLVHVKCVKGLTKLYLNDLKITDAGLAHLHALKGLTYLNVRRTGVTAAGLRDFLDAVPGCKIEHDGGVAMR